MILLGLLQIIFELLKILFSWLSLPDMPEQITSIIDTVIQYVIDAMPIIWVFFDKSVVTVCFIIALACMNFEKVYDFLMWILAKLPIGVNRD